MMVELLRIVGLITSIVASRMNNELVNNLISQMNSSSHVDRGVGGETALIASISPCVACE